MARQRVAILRAWRISRSGGLRLQCTSGSEIVLPGGQWNCPDNLLKPGAEVVKRFTTGDSFVVTIGGHVAYTKDRLVGSELASTPGIRMDRGTLVRRDVDGGDLHLHVVEHGTLRKSVIVLPAGSWNCAVERLVPGVEVWVLVSESYWAVEAGAQTIATGKRIVTPALAEPRLARCHGAVAKDE